MKLIKKILKTVKRVSSPLNWGTFYALKPVSNVFGFDRGNPIDRYYIENFLKTSSIHIKGIILEIGDDTYSKKYGLPGSYQTEVLHVSSRDKIINVIGNLETGEGIPKNHYDCMIVTQTFHVIYNVKSAIENCYKALKNNGVLLATLPGISQISRYDMDRWGDYWRFTNLSAKLMFSEIFGKDNVKIDTYGNVLTSISFLQGLASNELSNEQLEYHDPEYQLLITVLATKHDK